MAQQKIEKKRKKCCAAKFITTDRGRNKDSMRKIDKIKTVTTSGLDTSVTATTTTTTEAAKNLNFQFKFSVSVIK